MLVCGVKNRNRAMQGDVVVVEVLPKSEWRGKVTALAESQGEERNSEENESKPMPTGETPPPPPMKRRGCVCAGSPAVAGRTSS